MNFRLLKVAGAVALAFAAGQSSAQIPDRIKMGFIVTMSGPGAATEFSIRKGVELAVDEINKAGGVAGKQIDLVTGDAQADPTHTVNEARRLIGSERVHIMIGPLLSQLGLAAAPIVTQAKVASIVSVGSTEYTAKVAPYSFSIIPPADVQAVAMVEHAIAAHKARTIAFIRDNGAQSKAAMEAAKAHATAKGVKWAGDAEFQYRASDITPQILSLRRTNPDALLMWPGTGEDHALIVKARDEVGWKVPIINGGGTALNVAPAKKVYERAFDGIPSTMLKSWTYCPGDPEGQGDLVKYKDRMRVFAGADASRIAMNYSAWGYDAVYAFKTAIESTKTVDGPRLAEWIESNGERIKAVSGPLKASKNNHFLFSDPKAIVLVVDTDKPRSDGYYRRITDCGR